MANKDYYDRIADALEILAGDDSHINDIDENMDYYDRIANALETLANGENNPGFAGFGLVCQLNQHGITNKTAGEIIDAFSNGQMVVATYEEDEESFVHILYKASYSQGDGYSFVFYNDSDPLIFTAETEDDYPSDGESGGGPEPEPN